MVATARRRRAREWAEQSDSCAQPRNYHARCRCYEKDDGTTRLRRSRRELRALRWRDGVESDRRLIAGTWRGHGEDGQDGDASTRRRYEVSVTLACSDAGKWDGTLTRDAQFGASGPITDVAFEEKLWFCGPRPSRDAFREAALQEDGSLVGTCESGARSGTFRLTRAP